MLLKWIGFGLSSPGGSLLYCNGQVDQPGSPLQDEVIEISGDLGGFYGLVSGFNAEASWGEADGVGPNHRPPRAVPTDVSGVIVSLPHQEQVSLIQGGGVYGETRTHQFASLDVVEVDAIADPEWRWNIAVGAPKLEVIICVAIHHQPGKLEVLRRFKQQAGADRVFSFGDGLQQAVSHAPLGGDAQETGTRSQAPVGGVFVYEAPTFL